MPEVRQLLLQQPQACDGCRKALRQGDLVSVGQAGAVICATCALGGDPPPALPMALGVPGNSAQREYDRRRRQERERARRERPRRLLVIAMVAVGGYFAVQVVAGAVDAELRAHGARAATPAFPPATAHLVGLLAALVAGVAVATELWRRRPSTEAWAIGAKGERTVAARLAKARDVIVLHDRRPRGSSANIDHIAVGPAGIYVIDTKTFSRGRVSVERRGPLWDRRPARLYVGGRDRSSVVDGIGWQVQAVQRGLWGVPEAAGVPIRPMVVIVGAGPGFLTRPSEVGGVWVGRPRESVRVLEQPGPLTPGAREAIARALLAGFPTA